MQILYVARYSVEAIIFVSTENILFRGSRTLLSGISHLRSNIRYLKNSKNSNNKSKLKRQFIRISKSKILTNVK